MSTERDDLVTEIMQHPWLVKGEFTGDCPSCPDLTIEGGYNSPSHAGHIATALLAAGFRKPRTVTNVEELDALPNESLILDAQNRCREGLTSIEGRNWWRTMGPAKVLASAEIQLPATVLHEGKS